MWVCQDLTWTCPARPGLSRSKSRACNNLQLCKVTRCHVRQLHGCSQELMLAASDTFAQRSCSCMQDMPLSHQEDHLKLQRKPAS